MPKTSKYPKLRTHIKRGKAGQVWTSYWYDMRGTGKPDIPLGSDYQEALKKWDEVHNDRPRIAGTLEEAFRKWEQEELPGHKEETRKGYTRHLAKIRPVFGPATWDAVSGKDIYGYLQKRSAKTQGNREMALLSVIWGKARVWGMVEAPFPLYRSGKWKHKESKRQVEVTDEAFDAIYKHADAVLRDAMDLATATGLRVRDVLGLRLSDVRGTRLVVEANKTGKRVEFDLSASAVLPAIIERRKQAKAPHLFLLTFGDRIVTERMLRDRFAEARDKAAKEVPEVAGMFMRDCRKRAAQLADSLQEASRLLQHSSTALTASVYRGGEKVKPVR